MFEINKYIAVEEFYDYYGNSVSHLCGYGDYDNTVSSRYSKSVIIYRFYTEQEFLNSLSRYREQ